MTTRLASALSQLGPEEMDQITEMAEALAHKHEPAVRGELKLDWVGCLKGAPEKTGVEAAKRANEMRMELLDKSMPK